MTDDAISVNEPGAEFCAHIAHEAGWQFFAVPRRIVEGDKGTERPPYLYRYRVRNQKQRAEIMRNLFDRALSAVARFPFIENSPAMDMLEADLKSLLIPILNLAVDDSGYLSDGSACPIQARLSILNRARKLLRERNNRPIHVSELAKYAGVSERTLRRAFNEAYGVGPRAFTFLRQLVKARKTLLISDAEETTVTEILTGCGIWEFGRFAGRYKLHFGETPSQTLARTQGRQTNIRF